MSEEASGYMPALMEQAWAKAKEADLAEARRLAQNTASRSSKDEVAGCTSGMCHESVEQRGIAETRFAFFYTQR
jgi:hypothetical protein